MPNLDPSAPHERIVGDLGAAYDKLNESHELLGRKHQEVIDENERLREAIADAMFALDHSDIDGAKGYLLYALGEQESRPALEENERLRRVVDQVKKGADWIMDEDPPSPFKELTQRILSVVDPILDGGGDHD